MPSLEPTTGAPYDGYDLPEGCTGYWREDADWGECLTHERPCPVHNPNNCPLCGSRDGWCSDEAACEARVAEQVAAWRHAGEADPAEPDLPDMQPSVTDDRACSMNPPAGDSQHVGFEQSAPDCGVALSDNRPNPMVRDAPRATP